MTVSYYEGKNFVDIVEHYVCDVCKEPANSSTKFSGTTKHYCFEHAPEHIKKFRDAAFMAMRRGRAMRQLKLKLALDVEASAKIEDDVGLADKVFE